MVKTTDQFVYLSLGAGVQSSALMVMSALGTHECPRAAVAFFADTQDEPAWVYEHLEVLKQWGMTHGLPVVTVTNGRLSENRRVKIPAFVADKDGDGAPLTRNCTQDYKIAPIRRMARHWMTQAGQQRAVCLFGISADEASRMRLSPVQWIENVYPLVTARLSRSSCARILLDAGLPVPRKSACVFCPYRSDRAWRELRDHDAEGWAAAIAYDTHIREHRHASLHRSLIPLHEVDFGENHPGLFDEDCSGMCGV